MDDGRIASDLTHILYRYQLEGIKIYENNGTGQKIITLQKPSRFKSLFYRFSLIAGLKRNVAGGFGGMIPELVEQDGAHYYGVG